MKKLQTLFLVAIATFLMVGNVYADFEKIPLLERFTNASCGPCKIYNQAGFTNWINANNSKLAIVHYQVSWPGRDPMYSFNTTVPDTRVSQYTEWNAITGVPTVCFNGKMPNGKSQPSNSELNQLLATESAKRVPAKITPTITIEGGIAKVHIEIFSEQAVLGHKLQVLIIQDMVSFATAPGTNGETEFPTVVRWALPNMNGEEIELITNGTVTRDYTQDISGLLGTKKLHVVAFLEEPSSSHNILQAGVSESVSSTIKELNFEVTQNIMYQKVANETNANHTVTIKNTNNFDITVTSEVGSASSNWVILENKIPASFDIAANSTVTYSIVTKSDAKPSSNLLATFFTANYKGSATDYQHPTAEAVFIDLTSNVKYGYLTGLGGYPSITIEAMNTTPQFNGELVEIPFYGEMDWLKELCQSNLLDNLEFLGISAQTDYFMYGVYVGADLLSKIANIHNNGGKLYLETYMHYYYIAYYKSQLPSIYNTLETFTKQIYGSWCSTGLTTLPMNNGTYYTTLTAAAKDNEISKGENIVLNEQQPLRADIDYFDYLEEGASMVYSYKASQFSAENILMTKYEKGNARSVNTGINISSVAPNIRNGLANSIIEWLFKGSVTTPPDTLTVTVATSEHGTVEGAGKYVKGAECILKATANTGYEFVSWLEDGTVVSTNANYKFTVTKNITLTANFQVVGIKDNTILNTFTATPTPADADITLHFGLLQDANTSFEVCDIAGSVIYQADKFYNVGDNLLVINTNAFANGTYICKMLVNGKQVGSTNFIIAR